MAVADTNVRPRRQATVVTARGVRRSCLARLLLQLLELFQLDRKLFLLFAASLTPACIIPVGPNWQDPPGEPNAAPTIISVTPEEGSQGTTGTFRIVLSDAEGDQMWVKWFVNFPPYIAGISWVSPQTPLSGSGPGTPFFAELTFDCVYQLPPGQPTHRIEAAIHDGKFMEGEGVDPLTTVDGRPPLKFVWLLDKVCSGSR